MFYICIIVGILIFISIFWGKSNYYEFIGLKPLYPEVSMILDENEIEDENTNIVTTDIQETQNITYEDDMLNTEPAIIKNPVRIRNNRIWKREERVRALLEEYYNLEFKTIRPKWLTNPETGSCLELDCYNDELGIAVEVNGEQHYIYPNVFHRTEHQFIQQVRRDRLKRHLCQLNNVYLIIVPYTILDNELEYYLYDNLRQFDLYRNNT